MDKKLELFLSKELWQQAIEHGIKKGISRSVLNFLSEPESRMKLASMIWDGKYEIAPPRVGLIPKNDNSGDYREVYINTELDRMILYVINNIYFKLYGNLIHKNCVSYQKGIGVKHIIKEISHKLVTINATGYKIDISKYFDSVSPEWLNKMLDKIDSGSPMDKLIRTYFNTNVIIDNNGKIIKHYKSLAQGCAVGAFLANISLADIDEKLSIMDIHYYRYSDDILMIGKDADKAFEVLKSMLSMRGLSINPKKVERIDSTNEFTFLGFAIKGSSIGFSNKTVERFKKEIRSRTKSGKNRTLKKSVNSINNYLYTAYLKNEDNFGWGEYFFGIVTREGEIAVLDNYIKDHLKHVVTGKWNHTHNKNKVSETMLRESGYKSMVQLYKEYRNNPWLYRQEILTM